MNRAIKHAIKLISSVHWSGDFPNVFLFSTPRSGSTWLTELIWGQPGFKYLEEPLNLRNSLIQHYSGITEWQRLYSDDGSLALQNYFQALCDGRLCFMDPGPFRRHYRPITRRIVFKVIHGGEDRINWFRDTFNGQIVYLVRHPIAVSLSRQVYPRLHALLESDYRRHFSRKQLEYANSILDSGTNLERGVLSWCLQNAVPLQQATDDWAIVSYEQMVLDPDSVIEYLAHKLELPRPERMRSSIAIPSRSTVKSGEETRQMLDRGPEADKRWLVEKWRGQVDEAEEHSAIAILEQFHLDAYKFGRVLPANWLWIGSGVPSNDC
ncbi:MAG: sulfotransferase [Planctomycetes bacterium]|nr:sulfotransferase [Planctomycetota bacterium]